MHREKKRAAAVSRDGAPHSWNLVVAVFDGHIDLVFTGKEI